MRAERKASYMEEEEILRGIPENKDDVQVLPVNRPYKIGGDVKKKQRSRTRPFPQLSHMNTFLRQFQSVCIPFCICFICCYFNQFANHFCALV